MENRQAEITIPHSPPFLFVDTIVELNSRSIMCEKHISNTDQYLVYSNGEQEYVSQAALLECVLQSGAYLMKSKELSAVQAAPAKKMYFVGSPAITFGQIPVIGDVLRIKVELTQELGQMARLYGQAVCNSTLVLEGTFMVAEK